MTVDRGLEVHQTGMAYRLDGGLGDRARIGLIVLATDQSIEHEFRCLLNLPGVAVYHSRIENSPNITPETLAEMADGITDAARVIMPGLPMDVIAYACTSGAMVIGADAVAEKIHAARPGVACTTPMAATVAALQALPRGGRLRGAGDGILERGRRYQGGAHLARLDPRGGAGAGRR
jgi:maleate isomerase